ncbi:aspartate--tRNA ligase [Thermosediminibacter oceani]|uniref:Aspartate--tRNA ligase n=1 Tax=Thermosediminibacter oceani (strain ATCC BAA-1034 / DSM 16646 / JW/IW-1228P) TaxID=555079 RepID=D9RXN9_THEOJ|nr:aspartate--tRNA ligase [Thermosediminibacter oceani]ADL08113.1 aspartyl-tRNA synthetase [Thermosediminibacter oceani DSM 16646]
MSKKIKRTHHCGLLTSENTGQDVVLAGWVQTRRDLGGLIFVDLRDRSGVVQVVFSPEYNRQAFEKADELRSEFVIAVKGKVFKRPEENVNPKIPTGEIEVFVEELEVLNKAKTPPFPIEDDIKVDESLRLKYRYLDLRRPSMLHNMTFRHKVNKAIRDFLDENGFIEVETPMLTRSTPEGARDFLVPSRLNPGTFYALPQSPQLFKQILMVAGMERYYQITRCFRDEDLRADRQPEFTQLDIEMSFVDVDDVISLNEKLVKYVVEKTTGRTVEIPFRRITYRDAMEIYGSDKPDTRFGLEMVDVTDIAEKTEFKVFSEAAKSGGKVKGINIKNSAEQFSRRQIDELVEKAKEFGAKGLAWISLSSEGIKSPIAKFFAREVMDELLERMGAQPGDLLIFVADSDSKLVVTSLGQLRLHLGRQLNLIDKNKLNFLWVVEFPLLEWDEEEKRYVAMHHPFTSPMDEDLDLLEEDPGRVRAKAYDLVLNGTELGGGSIRIHRTEIQERMFKVLGFTKERAWNNFGFLLRAFEYGTPPHGGIAYGLDRMVMLLLGLNSIRDCIAFPKTQNASCLLTEAPAQVEPRQLKELYIQVTI